MTLKVKSINTIVEERGGRVSWGNNNIIAFGGLGEDNYYDLWTIKPDGSDARCLTCENPKIAQLHNGQPTWHPSGRFVIFQSQDPSLPHSLQFDLRFTDPALGIHNNLWATDPEGKSFFQLTHVKKTELTLHSHFSHDGKKLIWSQNSGMMIADFVETPEPHIENIEEYHPIKDMVETHSYSPDDSKILFTAFTRVRIETRRNKASKGDDNATSFMKGKFRLGTDGIWEFNVSTQDAKKIEGTGTAESWDEHAHYSPDGKRLIWTSSQGQEYGGKTMQEVLETTKLDYWVMDADGSNKHRLTHFNEPGHGHYLKGNHPVKPVDFSWSPNGKRLVACLLRGNVRELAKIVIIDLTNE